MALLEKKGTTKSKKEAAPNTDSVSAPEMKMAAAISQDRMPAVAGASVFIQEPGLVEACMDAEWDTFTSLSASSGTHYTNGKEDLGKVIQFQVVYSRPVWKMSANSNDEESTEYFRSSYLGEEDLEDAKQEAIIAGYEKAGIKQYVELFILITDATENPDFVGELLIMNLAPSSIRNWKPLAGKLKVKSAMKKLETTQVVPGFPAVTFQSTAKPATWQGNNFTIFEFEIV